MTAGQGILNVPADEHAADKERWQHNWVGSEISPTTHQAERLGFPRIYVIDDDMVVRTAGRKLFASAGYDVREHCSAEAFLANADWPREACLVVDVDLPGISGLALLKMLQTKNLLLPVIILTARRDSASAVVALQSGASDFIEKPADQHMLLASVKRAIERTRVLRARAEAREEARARIRRLTAREYDVMKRVLDGMASKNIAADLKISQRTVESHRCRVMSKTGSRSIPQLVKLYLEATEWRGKDHDH